MKRRPARRGSRDAMLLVALTLSLGFAAVRGGSSGSPGERWHMNTGAGALAPLVARWRISRPSSLS